MATYNQYVPADNAQQAPSLSQSHTPPRVLYYSEFCNHCRQLLSSTLKDSQSFEKYKLQAICVDNQRDQIHPSVTSVPTVVLEDGSLLVGEAIPEWLKKEDAHVAEESEPGAWARSEMGGACGYSYLDDAQQDSRLGTGGSSFTFIDHMMDGNHGHGAAGGPKHGTGSYGSQQGGGGGAFTKDPLVMKMEELQKARSEEAKQAQAYPQSDTRLPSASQPPSYQHSSSQYNNYPQQQPSSSASLGPSFQQQQQYMPQPQHGQPQHGQPQHGQPQHGQPQHGQPQYHYPPSSQPQQQQSYHR